MKFLQFSKLEQQEGRVGGLGEKGNLTTLGSFKLNLEQIAEAPKNKYTANHCWPLLVLHKAILVVLKK